MVFYCFDSGCFINGRRDLLRPTVFLTLWSNIEDEIAAGTIRSPDIVRDEIAKRDDEVTAWVKAQNGLFVPLDADVQQATKNILGAHKKLVGTGGRRSGADPFVIALAMVHSGTVVTEETPSGNLDRPKIPDVCDDLGVPWTNLMGYIEEQGWTF